MISVCYQGPIVLNHHKNYFVIKINFRWVTFITKFCIYQIYLFINKFYHDMILLIAQIRCEAHDTKIILNYIHTLSVLTKFTTVVS